MLLLGSRPYLDEVAYARIAALATGGIDWAYVLRQSVYHGTATLLYRNLRHVDLPGNAMALAQLRPIARTAARRSLFLLGELLKITAAFEAARIPAMPLKGPILAISAYGDVAPRVFSDLDLLVRYCDLHRAANLLIALGFRCRHHKDWVERYVRFGHELDFTSADDSVQVDLQWRFAKRWLSMPVDPTEVWRDARLTSIDGRLVYQASPELNLLILCGHGYRHGWSRLKWVMDICAFLHRYSNELDAIRLRDYARARGGLRLLKLGLWLAREIGGNTTHHLLEGCPRDDEVVRRLVRSISARLFMESSAGPRGSAGLFQTLLFHWRAKERLREKLPSAVPLLAHAGYLVRRQVRHHVSRIARSSTGVS